MIFSSYAFLFVFLPLVLVGYALVGRIWGQLGCKIWLVAASLAFYAQSNSRLFFLLAGTVVFNHLCIMVIREKKRGSFPAGIAFAASMVENLGLLFYFKYYNFFFDSVNRVVGTEFVLKTIILPLGISFFTFQILSYVIDVYRGNYQSGTFLNFALFVTFFPQLIVGPIIRYDEMEPQLKADGFGRFDPDNVMEGIVLFCIGCFKKIILADPLITHAQAFYDGSASADTLLAWSGVLAFTFAYYFDFSGYIDMALGLGRFFNIRLPQNFNSPYKAVDFADFWRRWNMSISFFFHDYIFKNIFRFGDRIPKLILATMVTFLVSGVWHGAGWHFIAWGLFNGALVCVANIMTVRRIKVPAALGWCFTFFFAVMARVLFDSGSMTQAVQVYRLLFDFGSLLGGGLLPAVSAYLGQYLGILLLILLSGGICFFLPNSNEIVETFRPKPRYAILCGLGLAVALFFMGTVSNFLYFQF